MRNGLRSIGIVAKASCEQPTRIEFDETRFHTAMTFTDVDFHFRLFNNRTVLTHVHSCDSMFVIVDFLELCDGAVVCLRPDLKAVRHYSRG